MSTSERDDGDATILYEGPDGTVERSVRNEHLLYFQDHWLVRTGGEGSGTVRRIPAERVYYVEREVDALEEVGPGGGLESVAREIRDKLFGTRGQAGDHDRLGAEGTRELERTEGAPPDRADGRDREGGYDIEVTAEEDGDSNDGTDGDGAGRGE